LTAARNIALLAFIGCASRSVAPSTEAPTVHKPGPATAVCHELPERHRLDLAADLSRDFEAAQAAFAQARAKSQVGDLPGAMPLYEESARLDPTFGFAHLGLAETQLLLGTDRDRTLAHAATAADLLPNTPRAHHVLARVLKERGAVRPARIHLMCALELRPSLHQARADLAILQIEERSFSDAVSTLNELTQRQGPEVQTQVLLARAYAGMKRWSDAGEAMERAAQRAGQNAVLLRRAARLYDKGGFEELATTARLRADAIDPPPEGRDLRPLRPSRR